MRFQSRLAAASKLGRASLIAMALAILAVRAGERVGYLGAGYMPGHTRNSLARLAENLSAPAADFPSHAELSRFSTCVLLSDFLEPIQQIGDKLVPIAAQVRTGHLVQIADPAEEAFPFRGRTEFVEMAGLRNLTFGRAETMKEDYQRLYLGQRAAVKDLAQRLGWTFAVHHTDESALNVLLSLFMLMSDEDYRPSYRPGAA
jgi:uncharacterized protein (DUF58 family)